MKEHSRARRSRSISSLKAPQGFVFYRTVFSHGWIDLPPFAWDEVARELSRTVACGAGRTALARVTKAERGRLSVRVLPSRGDTLGAADKRRLLAQVRHMLRLDEPFDEFHAICRSIDGFTWIPAQGAGPILRSPSPYEDLVKLICTTNCSWALTRSMVQALVRDLGEPWKPESGEPDPGARSFPAPAAMAAASARYYTRTMKAGYRAPFLRELARRVASGRLDPDSWLDASRPGGEIRDEVASVKGAGRYVVDNMMKLLGRYDGLGLDSWCRKKFARIHRNGRAAADRVIEKFYAPFGPWRGLAIWCDLTRDWFDESRSVAYMLRKNMY